MCKLIMKMVFCSFIASFIANDNPATASEKDPEMLKLGTCMVKTHLSLSHDPTLKGRPKGWVLPVRDVQAFMGAGFFVPIAGDIKLMPGMASDPAFRYVDVDVNTGKVKGLF